MITLTWRADRTFAIALIGLTFFVGLLPLGNAFLGAKVIDQIAAVTSKRTDVTAIGTPIIVIVAFLAILAVGGAIASLFIAQIEQLYRMKCGHFLSNILLRKAASLELQQFEDPIFHDKLQSASNEVNARPIALVQQLVQCTTSAITATAAIGFLFAKQPYIIALIAAYNTTYFIFASRLEKVNYQRIVSRTSTER